MVCVLKNSEISSRQQHRDYLTMTQVNIKFPGLECEIIHELNREMQNIAIS